MEKVMRGKREQRLQIENYRRKFFFFCLEPVPGIGKVFMSDKLDFHVTDHVQTLQGVDPEFSVISQL